MGEKRWLRARRERRLSVEPLERRVLLSADGLEAAGAGEVVQVGTELPYGISGWYEPHLSDDGRYVAISARARLTPDDTNDLDDVYLVDLETKECTWISRPDDGSQPDDGSWQPEISPDGRYVAFMSRADNLVAEDQDPSIDLFVYDRASANLECITAGDDGDASAARFSGDGEKIVYGFEFHDAHPSDPNDSTKDIVLYDRITGQRRLVTKAYDGGAANDISWQPHISQDGSCVVFQSLSSNLVPNDSQRNWDVFLYNVATDTIECLSVNAEGNPANGASQLARISGDGRFVTFQSSSTELAAANADSFENIYLLDRATGEITSIAGDLFPDSRNAAVRPDISTDGRYVLYHGSSTNGSQTASNTIADVYVYDRVTGETLCVSRQPNETPAKATSAYASISGDGGSVAFISDATNLTAGPAPASMDVFVMANPFTLPPEYDFGDAPVPYVTTASSDGARHRAGGPMLGSVRDLEISGVPSPGADGDDREGVPDDEEGVVFGTIQVGRLDATATVLVTGAPGGARLDAWIDFNGDGSWGGTGERIAEGAVVSEGANTIRFDVPSWALPGETYARFRLSTAGVPAVTGAAADGEVEDYRVTIEPPAAGSGFFVPQKPLAGELSHPSDVFAADLDGDGDLDVLVASEWNDRVAWYENQGSGRFTPHTITTSLDLVHSVSAADLDGDGDLDVLAVSESQDGVFWYENQGGAHFGDATSLGYVDEAMSVFAADLDEDGDVDVLSTSLLQGVYWYENNGEARFTVHTITENARGAWSVFAADMDGDGDTDVLSASAHDDTVAWYENDGSEGFTQRIITTTADWARSVRAADLDGDGDMDVLSASTNDDTIAWYENNGSQQFTPHVITHLADEARSVFTADMDEDGDVDVVSASWIDDKIAWYENDGAANFIERTITTSADGATAAIAADLDGDGDLDVLSASAEDNVIAWHENDGEEHFRPATIATSALGAQTVLAVDLDGDGDMDVLSAAALDDRILWYENDGAEWFTSHTIVASVDGAWSVHTVDLDGDGDVDVLSASAADDRIAWYENDGRQNFEVHTITAVADGARSVWAADIDGDGDLDVLSASAEDNKIAWYENDGEEGFTDHRITAAAMRAGSVSAADIDGDGDIDVISGCEGGQDEIAWYENDGLGRFAIHSVAIFADGATYVVAADLDQDGDMDLVGASWIGGKIAWYENDGEENFTVHTLISGATEASSVFVADVEGDGDMDILWAASGGNKIGWLQNDGQESFSEHAIANSRRWARSVTAADVDGDGDLDVLSAAYNEVAWYEQAAELPAELGEVDWRELPGLDLSAGDKLYRFTGAHAGILTVDATFNPAGGEVTLRLFDEAGTLVDEMTGHNGNARFDYSQPTGGAAYLLQVTGVNPDVDLRICNLVENVAGAVTVHGTAASDDFRYLAGAEHKLTINSIPYRFGLRKIRTVHFAGGAGSDVAVLTGSAANETARLLPGRGSITNTSLPFTVSVDDAWDITISGGGGYDTLDVTDSDGDDRLVISPGLAEMTGTSAAGGAYAVRGNAFRIVNGYAKSGGNDTALMNSSDSARAKVYPDLVKLTAANSYGRVKFFDTTTVEMLAGSDTGVVSPSTRQDALLAMKGEARVAYNLGLPAGSQPAFDGLAYNVTILGCEWLTALADGGDDWVELHDSALNDVLIAKPHKTEMMNGPRAADGILRGEEYAISARRYQNVRAIADQGGEGDGAKLYDSAELGVDVWAAGYVDGKTWSAMSSPNRRLYEVLAFDQVGGYGFNGGLGPDHGTNRTQHTPETDFVFQAGYWEDDE